MRSDEQKLWAALNGDESHFACAMLLKNRGFGLLPGKILDWTRPRHAREVMFIIGLRALADARTRPHLVRAVAELDQFEEHDDAVKIALHALIELGEGADRIDYERAFGHADVEVRQLAAALMVAVGP